MKAFVGCSGFNYRGWKGKFYPAELPQSKWLDYYCRHFNTIEINATFYRFPTVKSLNTWYTKTPGDFVFTVKAPQSITHFQRFKNTKESSEKFYEVCAEGLKEKLHCLIFQLPPSLSYNKELMAEILDNLDPRFKNVLEFRNLSWWCKEVYEELEKNKIIFCSSSFPKLPEDFIKTSKDAYIRFHGREELYKSSYSEAELETWGKSAKKQKVENLYVYFNNTWFLAAVENAAKMKELLKTA